MGQLSVELQARIETATEEIEAFIDKDWGVLDKRIESKFLSCSASARLFIEE